MFTLYDTGYSTFLEEKEGIFGFWLSFLILILILILRD